MYEKRNILDIEMLWSMIDFTKQQKIIRLSYFLPSTLLIGTFVRFSNVIIRRQSRARVTNRSELSLGVSYRFAHMFTRLTGDRGRRDVPAREENDRRGARKESERWAVYAGQYYRAIPSEMPRLGLLGMSHCKQWTMRLLLLHNGHSLARSLARDLTWPLSPPYFHLRWSHEHHHLRRGYKSTLLFLLRSARYQTASRSTTNISPINDENLSASLVDDRD